MHLRDLIEILTLEDDERAQEKVENMDFNPESILVDFSMFEDKNYARALARICCSICSNFDMFESPIFYGKVLENKINNCLGEVCKNIFKIRFGMDGDGFKSLKETAKFLSFSVDEVEDNYVKTIISFRKTEMLRELTTPPTMSNIPNISVKDGKNKKEIFTNNLGNIESCCMEKFRVKYAV